MRGPAAIVRAPAGRPGARHVLAGTAPRALFSGAARRFAGVGRVSGRIDLIVAIGGGVALVGILTIALLQFAVRNDPR